MNSQKALAQRFFNRPTLRVARELLGCVLARKVGRGVVRQVITEVEAYDGFRDKASHAHRGVTRRNTVMFGEAGRWYVYFTYGMHWMLNVVTGPRGYPAAVLIRGTDRISGPARLTKTLRIDGQLNGKKLSRASGLWIEKGRRVPERHVVRTPRVGVSYAGAVWAGKKYRFVLTPPCLHKNKKSTGALGGAAVLANKTIRINRVILQNFLPPAS